MTRQIASIYYEPSSASRPLYARKPFALPAVKKGDPPFLLTIHDHVQWEDEPQLKANAPRRQRRETITGEEIARDLLTHWTEHHPDMNPQCRPGIWIVRDTVALFDEEGKPVNDANGTQATRPATQEEKDAMFAEDLASNSEVQANWGQKAIDKGNLMADDPKKIQWIPEYCRSSARYYGHTPAWLKRQTDSDIKTCPWCTKVIAAAAIKCPNCHEVVDQARYAALKGRMQPELAAAPR